MDGWISPVATVTEHDSENERSGQGNISRSRLLITEKVKINLEDAMLPEKNHLAPLPGLPHAVIQLNKNSSFPRNLTVRKRHWRIYSDIL
jgi:hypothetical protein